MPNSRSKSPFAVAEDSSTSVFSTVNFALTRTSGAALNLQNETIAPCRVRNKGESAIKGRSDLSWEKFGGWNDVNESLDELERILDS